MEKNGKSLKFEFVKSFGIIVVAVILLGLVTLVGILTVRSAEREINFQNEEMADLYEAETAHYKWGSSLNSTIEYGMEFTGATDPTQCEFGKLIYSAEVQNDPASQSFLATIEPLHRAIHESAVHILQQVPGNQQGALEIYRTETMPKIDELIANLDAMIEQKGKLVDEAEKQFDRTIVVSAIFCTILIVIVFISCFRLYHFLRKEIVGNIGEISNQIKKLSEGDLSVDLTSSYETNEMRSLRDGLEFSVKELAKYVQAIDFGMTEFSKGNFTCECPHEFLGYFASIQRSIETFQDKMNYTLSELDSTANQVSKEASQVAGGAQTSAQGATEQASSVEEVSATILDVSKQVSQTAEYSKKANSLGKQAGEVVQRSQEEMKQLMQSIRDIASASENIQKINKVIEDIAFQTNILALNAAVEAARAGAAGKGFAVVADEVRNLAQKSAEAAKDTTELIDNSLQHIEKGERLAKNTETAFSEVSEHTVRMLDMVEKIAQASDEQSKAIEQISEGVSQISSVVQMSAATAEESAAASQELSGQADMMKELLGQFHLKEGGMKPGAMRFVPEVQVQTESFSNNSDKY